MLLATVWPFVSHFSCIGLLTLLISIGLLFSGPGAIGGLIAGSVLLGAGFIVTTPSAVHLVKDPKDVDDKDRGRSESVAIILPTPEFRKNVVPRLVGTGLAHSCLVLSCVVLSCLVLFCLALSCVVLFRLVLSRLFLSCLALSCAGFWRRSISGPLQPLPLPRFHFRLRQTVVILLVTIPPTLEAVVCCNFRFRFQNPGLVLSCLSCFVSSCRLLSSLVLCRLVFSCLVRLVLSFFAGFF